MPRKDTGEELDMAFSGDTRITAVVVAQVDNVNLQE